MTLDEANKIGAIVATADSRCSVCVGSLVKLLQTTFPEFRWEIESELYREDWFDDDMEDGEHETVRVYQDSDRRDSPE